MPPTASVLRRCLTSTFIGFFLSLTCASLSAKTKWAPIPAADLARKECEKYPGAAGEVLFKKQALDADSNQTWCEFDVRMKIYNAKGAQDAGSLNIEYPSESEPWELAARVTKADGTSIELGKKDFHDSVAAKNNRGKIKSKTVAVPNLEAGDIVEYHWNTVVSSESWDYNYWFLDSALPTREFTFILRGTKSDCQVLWFNVGQSKNTEIGGSKAVVFTDIAPYVEEPLEPAGRDIRGWIATINTSRYLRHWKKDEFWKAFSSELYEDFHLLTKPSSDVTKLAGLIVQGATTDEEKLKRIYDYCREKITNLSYFDNAELQAARKKLENSDNDQSVAQTLKRKYGWSGHINALFASLCRGAGFEVRRDLISNRSRTTLVKHDQGYFFLEHDLVAVRQGAEWKYYGPGDYFAPFGVVDWEFQSAPGLLCEDDKFNFVNAPVALAATSVQKRVGKFTLDTEGNLEGTVEFTYTGNAGAAKKYDWFAQQRSETEKEIRESVTDRIPTAELSDFKYENIDGIQEPVKVTFALKIPGYAELAGERLIIVPSVFQKGTVPRFTSDTRKHPIHFHYAWTDKDLIEIVIPEGYELDAPTAPKNVSEPTEPIRARFGISMKRKAHTLVFQREAVYGDLGMLAIPAIAYPTVKKYYEDIAHSDDHTLVLKPKAVAEPAPAAGDGK